MRTIGRKQWDVLVLIGIVFLWMFPISVYAVEGNEYLSDGELWEQTLDFSDIQDYLDSLNGGGEGISFQSMMEMLMAGKWKEAGNLAVESVKNALFSEISSGSQLFLQILVIGIAGAVFANFTSVFEKSQITDAGFYITYLLLFSLLAAGFMSGLTIASNVIGTVIGFMRALMPAYFMAVAFSGNTGSALLLYEATLFFVFVMEKIVQVVLIPLLKTYVFLVLAGHISKEDILSKMTSLVEKCVSWAMKTMIGTVVGFHVLQGLVLPYVDAVKTGGIQKVISVIPGIGQATGTVMQMVLGSGVLIKNTMGAVAMILLVAICVLPVVKLSLLTIFYHLASAVLQPICDKRMVSCISETAHGYRLLVSMVLTVCALFFISIAVVCASSNATYFSG